jgi:hypothetical protein
LYHEIGCGRFPLKNGNNVAVYLCAKVFLKAATTQKTDAVNGQLIKPRRRIKIAVQIGCLAFLAFLFRPHLPANPDKVHPDVRSIEFPIKDIVSTGYLDGGSSVIYICDAKDEVVLITIPPPSRNPFYRSPKIFLGGRHYLEETASEVIGYPHTSRAARQLIRDHRPRNFALYRASDHLSPRAYDFVLHLVRRYVMKPDGYLDMREDSKFYADRP